MKHTLLSSFLLFAAIIVVPVHAQTTEADSDSTEDETVSLVGLQNAPLMPRLFYRNEQRRILEAVRQGIVQENDFDIEEFVPVVILQDVLPNLSDELFEDESILSVGREGQVHFNAYILNRQNGKGILWINGNEIDWSTQAAYLDRFGIDVQPTEEHPAVVQDGVLFGADAYNTSRFEVKIGQVINTDGSVEETLPVVIRKN